MANYTTQPWLDPSKNTVAQNDSMEPNMVKPVLLVGTDGEPYNATGSGGGGGSSSSATTAAVTSVVSSTSSVQLLASNTNRVEAIVTNQSSQILYLKLGSAASLTSFTINIGPNEAFVIDKFSGEIHGIWPSVHGSARITETT